ncbi:hypothetical protein BE04_13095 [Sorangium cellulosum]|uniref:Uncharacterized protein n=1 Tax=Sorangium cellulosum TaxID=56 RepID=A0A150Q7D0_SORCE|nr:hypothetical protein BE04_13095 [Sorangium cellulosum]
MAVLVTATPRPSPPTPPTPPPSVSCVGSVAICCAWAGTAASAPFCAAVSRIRTLRSTVSPFKPARTVTRPPMVPLGVNVAVLAGPALMAPSSPRSTDHPTLMGASIRVAV